MKLLQRVLARFNGLHYRQEYLCMAKEPFASPMHVYLTHGQQVLKNITTSHLFTGYAPLIFTLYAPQNSSEAFTNEIEVVLSQRLLQPNEILQKKDAIARLSLKKTGGWSAGDLDIVHYGGLRGTHHFLSSFHQFIIALSNRLYSPKTGNVYLHDNLYKQVQIAYAIPRVISLITVGNGSLYNLFPTDLNGPVGEQYYACSLRQDGKACKQVLETGRMVISQVHCDLYKTVYALGKNHMKEMLPKDRFPFGENVSSILQLPLPQQVLHYREMELTNTSDHGIHKILLFKILSQQTTGPRSATLSHIHTVYASWRRNNGLPGNYLMR